jgi:hypothetical protein
MLGSLEDSEDLVQETFLRAWRNRAGFSSQGRSHVGPAGDPAVPPPPPADLARRHRRSDPAALKLVDSTVSKTGVMINAYRRAGDINPGSFEFDKPTEAELERRRRLATV